MWERAEPLPILIRESQLCGPFSGLLLCAPGGDFHHGELLSLHPEQTLSDLAELFKIFGDATRIRILLVLFQSEVCVYDLAKLLNMTQSAISHQLRLLKQARLVKSRREGKIVFYSLADSHVRTMLDQGMEHIRE